jgi:hypothetical protein
LIKHRKHQYHSTGYWKSILNLYTNAFYAVTEKKKETVESYEPIVSVSTKKLNGKVEIRVKIMVMASSKSIR